MKIRSRHPLLRRAFSLLELMTVVTLVAIIVKITLTRIVESSDQARERTCYHHRAQINQALERYAVTNGTFATALSDVNTDEYFPGGIPVCEISGTPYTLNSTTHRVEGHTNSGNH